jgi:cyanate lyase
MNNHLSPHIIENKKDHDIWLWKARPWLGQAQICKAMPWLGQAQICKARPD